MAQTLNPRASVFRPCHEFDAYDFYLPESLLVSPNRSSVGNCDPAEYHTGSSYYHSSRPKYSDYDDYLMEPYLDYPPEEYGLYDESYFAQHRYYANCHQYAQPPSRRSHRPTPPHYRRNQKNAPNNRYHPRAAPVPSRPNYAAVAKQAPKKPAAQRSSPPPAPASNSGSDIVTTAAGATTSMSSAGSSCSGSITSGAPSDYSLPQTTPVVNRTPSYDDDCELHLVRSQLEMYFSDKNLYEEQHSNLQYYMKLDQDRWVPLHVVCSLPAIRKLTTNQRVILKALRSSTLLELNSTEDQVRRPNYFPPNDYKVRKNLRRSVLVYGISEQMTDKELRTLLDMHGNILCIAFCGMIEGPEKEIADLIMAKKFNEHLNLTNLKSAFVVFESQSQANKCVKARSRSSPDNIRTMHKYDYNKVVKRIGKGQSPLFSSNQASLGELTPTPFNLTPTPQRISHRRTFGKNMTWKGATKSLNWRERPTMQTRSNSLQNRPVHSVTSASKRFSWMRKDHTNAWSRKENRNFGMSTHV